MSHEIVWNALVSYFVVIDPIGVALAFNALTGGKDPAYRRRMAFRSVGLSVVLVLCFGFFGTGLLKMLGIAIESFRIAGGLLLFYTAFIMVTRPDGVTPSTQGGELEDISVFPMSFPLMAGPGCLTLTILLFTNAQQEAEGRALLILAVGLVFLFALLCLLAAGGLSRLVGKTGNSVLKRLLGVLLASLSVQFIVDGIRGFLGP